MIVRVMKNMQRREHILSYEFRKALSEEYKRAIFNVWEVLLHPRVSHI